MEKNIILIFDFYYIKVNIINTKVESNKDIKLMKFKIISFMSV